MIAVMKSRVWWLVLAVLAAGTVLLVAGCSSDRSPTAPASSVDLGATADKAKPETFLGDVIVAPNIHTAPWFVQGSKKARLVSFEDVGFYRTPEPVSGGEYTATFDPVGGYNGPNPASVVGKLPFGGELMLVSVYTLPLQLALTHYEQDFESLVQAPYWLAGDGWWVYGNVYDGETYLYGHGPHPAPSNADGNFCDIVIEQGGTEQGAQQIVVYSNYANADHALGYLIESLFFQEQIIESGASGNWTLSFDAKKGNIEGSTTAAAFIKVLNPNAGWATTRFVTLDMTGIDETWGSYSVTLEDVSGLDGQHLQFGFMNTATNYEGSGIYYDNVVFTQ